MLYLSGTYSTLVDHPENIFSSNVYFRDIVCPFFRVLLKINSLTNIACINMTLIVPGCCSLPHTSILFVDGNDNQQHCKMQPDGRVSE